MRRSKIFFRNACKTWFAVATVVDPDILIVDEVLAVGIMLSSKVLEENVGDVRRRNNAEA